jgi:large subunit ribosomal protein L6
MSRIGKKIIPVPDGTKVGISEHQVQVQGPKGQMTSIVPEGIRFKLTDGGVLATRASDSKQQKALHGLARSLLANAVTGVSQGFKKELDIVGIGYRAEVKGNSVVFNLGFSHPIDFPVPEGISVEVERQTHLIVSGVDKQKVGQAAAEIRSLRKPDPYKNKGVRYTGERLKKKVGKTGAK